MQEAENHKKLKLAGVVTLAALALVGIRYSVYTRQQNRKLSSGISDKSAQIQSLNDKVTSLQATVNTPKKSDEPVAPTDKDAAQAAAQLYLDAQVLDTKYVATSRSA